jgi:holin-like protein
VFIQALLVLFCLLLGEGMVYATGLKVPPSILGMLLLTLFLKIGVYKAPWIKDISELLLRYLPLFFVPAGVGIMVYLGKIAQNWVGIVLASVLSFLLVLFVTGWTHQVVRKWGKRKRKNGQ